MWVRDTTLAETLQRDQTGLMCATVSPISRVSGTVEYNLASGLRRLTVEVDAYSLNSGWVAYDTHLPVLELEAMTLTALERWQERHIKRSLEGYKPWTCPRLMRALLAELLNAWSNTVPWKRFSRQP